MFDNNMADLFEDDKPKKKTREERKLEKIKAKQEKLEQKKIETDKILRQDDEIKFTKVDDKVATIKDITEIEKKSFEKEKTSDFKTSFNKLKTDDIAKRTESKPKKEKKKISVIEFLYDTLFGFITILLFLTSVGYLGYSYYKDNNVNSLIIGGLLVIASLFYMLSMFIKNDRLKKIFAIITSLALMGFMAFELFMI